jgi:hypothetical protein
VYLDSDYLAATAVSRSDGSLLPLPASSFGTFGAPARLLRHVELVGEVSGDSEKAIALFDPLPAVSQRGEILRTEGHVTR